TTVCPFQNYVVLFDIRGQNLLQDLRNMLWQKMLEIQEANAYDGSFSQVGGIRYTQNMQAAILEDTLRFAEVYDAKAGVWRTLDPDKVYRVITNNFIAAGGDGFVNFAEMGFNRMEFGNNLEDIAAQYLTATSPYTPKSTEDLLECIGLDRYVIVDEWPMDKCRILESTGVHVSLSCNAGSFRYVHPNRTQECLPCSPGTFSSNYSTATSCEPCPPGEFQSDIGKTFCQVAHPLKPALDHAPQISFHQELAIEARRRGYC
ncbi:hypothetical protein CYMTET_24430, partial [Cymbomonas tetramitiformis]